MSGFDIPDNDVAFNANQSIWMSTDIDILTAGLNGVGVVSGCAVTAQGSPDMTVAIAAGTIRVASGLYVTVASGNGTIGTADATNPRIDLVSASDTGTKTVTAGTAATNPKPPDLPAGHVALAMVYVPPNDTTIATNQITDKRVILPAGRGGGAISRLSSGDVTISATTAVYASNVTGISDLTIAANAGDWIEASLFARCNNTTGQSMRFDVVTVVSSAIVNAFSSGTSTPANLGCICWFLAASSSAPTASGSVGYTVQAGDISGGNVTLRLICWVSGGTRVLTADGTNGTVSFWAKNQGQ